MKCFFRNFQRDCTKPNCRLKPGADEGGRDADELRDDTCDSSAIYSGHTVAVLQLDYMPFRFLAELPLPVHSIDKQQQCTVTKPWYLP